MTYTLYTFNDRYKQYKFSWKYLVLISRYQNWHMSTLCAKNYCFENGKN